MKPPADRSNHPAIEALNAAVENPGPLRRMSDKRKFLIENFATIQKARGRKPRPLSYEKIAKILSANGVKVSSQLVKAVCQDHEALKKQGAAVLDGAATRQDKRDAADSGDTSNLRKPAKPPSRTKRPK